MEVQTPAGTIATHDRHDDDLASDARSLSYTIVSPKELPNSFLQSFSAAIFQSKITELIPAPNFCCKFFTWFYPEQISAKSTFPRPNYTELIPVELLR